MMKKFLYFLACIVTITSCGNKNKHTEKMHAFYSSVYENALKHGDVNVAIQAVYNIIANDSTKTNYYDTLTLLYLNTGNTGSTYLAARESLKYYPKDLKMIEVAAQYANSLKMIDTAIMWYTKAYVASNKLS